MLHVEDASYYDGADDETEEAGKKRYTDGERVAIECETNEENLIETSPSDIVVLSDMLSSEPVVKKPAKRAVLSKLLGSSYWSKFGKLTMLTKNVLKSAIDENSPDGLKSIGNIQQKRLATEAFIEAKESLKGGVSKVGENLREVQPSPGNEFMFAPIKESCHLFISGPTGSGKTRLACRYASVYLDMFPENSVIFISRLTDDPACLKLREMFNTPSNKRVANMTIDDDIVTSPPVFTDDVFSNALLIFDDLEGIQNEAVKLIMEQFLAQCLACIRHRDSSVISIQQLTFDREKSKLSLLESAYFVIFPHANVGVTMRVLKEKCGLSKDSIDYIMGVKSVWVAIKKGYPMCAISKDAVRVL